MNFGLPNNYHLYSLIESRKTPLVKSAMHIFYYTLPVLLDLCYK